VSVYWWRRGWRWCPVCPGAHRLRRRRVALLSHWLNRSCWSGGCGQVAQPVQILDNFCSAARPRTTSPPAHRSPGACFARAPGDESPITAVTSIASFRAPTLSRKHLAGHGTRPAHPDHCRLWMLAKLLRHPTGRTPGSLRRPPAGPDRRWARHTAADPTRTARPPECSDAEAVHDWPHHGPPARPYSPASAGRSATGRTRRR
jgi:hypothetical protein